MAGNGGWKVEVTGLRQLVDALGEMDKAALRSLTKEVTQAGKAVASNAAGRVHSQPMSGWGRWDHGGRDLGFNTGAVASGFKLRRNNYRRRRVSAGVGWDVLQTNAGGSVFEVIGDKSRLSGWRTGESFVDTVLGRFPMKQPRTLIPAYYAGFPEETRDKIRDSILDAARKAGLT